MSSLRYKDFKNEDAETCNRLVDFYNNNQLKYVKQMMDGEFKGGYGKRHGWEARGMIPRFRNITKHIVDMSAMAFNQPPTLETMVKKGKTNKEVDNPVLDTILQESDWLSFWQNVAAMTRLLKSVVVYNQKYIPFGSVTENQIYRFNPFNGEALKQIITHHGNSEVIMDPTGRFIVEFAYLTDLDDAYDDDDCETKPKQYMVITPSTIETWIFKDDEDFMVDVQVNPEGFVPAFFHHDTNKPIYGAWNKPGADLGVMNEIVNLHITDSEFATAWQKNPHLVTNGNIQGNAGDSQIPMAPRQGHTNPGQMYDDMGMASGGGEATMGGLGSIIQVTSDDNSRDPMFDYKGTSTDLVALNDVIHSFTEDVANDWCVNVTLSGKGSANSGFQLVVQEMAGLSLRTKQIHFFQATFRLMYEVLKKMYPELPNGQLFVNFPPPELPVNEAEREQNWMSRINSGRASIIDYLMEQDDLTKEEAIDKATEIKLFNQLYGPSAPAVTVPVEATPVVETEDVVPDEGSD